MNTHDAGPRSHVAQVLWMVAWSALITSKRYLSMVIMSLPIVVLCLAHPSSTNDVLLSRRFLKYCLMDLLHQWVQHKVARQVPHLMPHLVLHQQAQASLWDLPPQVDGIRTTTLSGLLESAPTKPQPQVAGPTLRVVQNAVTSRTVVKHLAFV